MGISRREGLLAQAVVFVPSAYREVEEKVLKVQIQLEGPLLAKPASVPKQVSGEMGERKWSRFYLPETQIMCEEGFFFF